MAADVLALLGVALLGALVVETIAFVLALHAKRIDSIDIVWGISLIAVISALYLLQWRHSLWGLIVFGLVVAWGSRLSWHIYRRFRRSHTQDQRYTRLMARWPQKYLPLQIFIRLFVVQALLATTISLPVIIVYYFQPATSWLTLAGLFVWFGGFVCELIADRQLSSFLARPNHDQLMTSGLWRYSRHPNYFGEIVMWWGVALIACATPLWWLGLVGAVTITYLICFVSGIPLTEKQAQTKTGWAEYKKRTSVLLPWPPKK